MPITLAAQTITSVTKPVAIDEEPHHHLILTNDLVRVYALELSPHDALLLHRHDHDGVSLVSRSSTTVSATPGQTDVLTIAKIADVNFSPTGKVHSVRNIGQDVYGDTYIALLRNQTGARNLCGNRIPDSPLNCPAAAMDANAPRVDAPQFETDQTRVTLTRIRPHRQVTLGEPDRDLLVVAADRTEISAMAAKDSAQTLMSGEPVWIPRGRGGRIFSNVSDKELSILILAFKP